MMMSLLIIGKRKKDESVGYVKNEVLSTAFSYARYYKAMEEFTGFTMKDCISLPGQSWKNFHSLREEEDEPISTYNDKYLRYFVRQSIKSGRFCAFKQHYKSLKCDDILKIKTEEIDVKGNIFDIIKACLKHKINISKEQRKKMKVIFTMMEIRMQMKKNH